MDSLLNFESVVKKWANKVIPKEFASNITYHAYGMTKDYKVDYNHGPKVTVDNVLYETHKPIALPGLVFTDWTDNDTTEPVGGRFTKSTTTASSRTSSVTVGIEVGFSVEESVNIEVVSSKMSFNMKIKTSATTSETTSKSESWSVDKTFTVPPDSSMEVIWSIGEQKLDIDFTADVTINGYAYAEGKISTHSDSKTMTVVQSVYNLFSEELPRYGIKYPGASNIKLIGQVEGVKFTLEGTLSGQNGITGRFQAIQHPLRSPGKVVADYTEPLERQHTVSMP